MQPIQTIQLANCQPLNEYELQMREQERKEQRRIQALEQIWEFMSQMYGELWTNSFGEIASEKYGMESRIIRFNG
nr:hypothetical protein [Wohlfahrtiimonas chitiniclastica]